MTVTCRKLQQKFYQSLGDREFDHYKPDEEQYLEIKIGYSLFGLPTNNKRIENLNGEYTIMDYYDKKQVKHIKDILKLIKTYSVYNKYNDIFVACMFNCCVLKKKPEKNDTEDNNVAIFPIFRVRKCFGSPTKNCSVYIDEHLRVYKDWIDYLNNNKIPKAKMFVPKDGIYEGNIDDLVLLHEIPSPACLSKEELIKVADHTTSAVSLISGGIMLGSLIPAVTVAPVVLAGAGLSGLGVGIYSIIRSSFILKDRNEHKQSLSLANKEARNCYLNIAAGATSVVTTGATKAANIVLNKGITISEKAATALVSVNFFNLTVSGCNVANSFYTVLSDIKNKEPSAIDIIHLSTSVLFFGNAVINFRSAYNIYTESQSKSLTEVIRFRSQDLLNKLKQNFYKKDMTTIGNNNSLEKINDSGEYYTSLIQAAVRAKGPISKTITSLLKNFIEEIGFETVLKYGFVIVNNTEFVYKQCETIFRKFEETAQEMLIKVLKLLINQVIEATYAVLNEIFPKSEIVIVFMNFIKNYIQYKASVMEINYQKDEIKADNKNDEGIEERYNRFIKIILEYIIKFFSTPKEKFLNEFVSDFWEWLNKKWVEYEFKKRNFKQTLPTSSNNKKIVCCPDCNGFYYQN